MAEPRPIVNSSVNASLQTACWIFVQLFRQGLRWVISVFESRLKRFCNARLGNQEEEGLMAEKGTDPLLTDYRTDRGKRCHVEQSSHRDRRCDDICRFGHTNQQRPDDNAICEDFQHIE